MPTPIACFSKQNLPRNLAGTRQWIRPQPSRQSVPLSCPISTDALLRIGEEYGGNEYGALIVRFSVVI